MQLKVFSSFRHTERRDTTSVIGKLYRPVDVLLEREGAEEGDDRKSSLICFDFVLRGSKAAAEQELFILIVK